MGAEELGLLMGGNAFRRLPPTATKEQQTAVINDILDRLDDMLKTQVFADASFKRMLIGYQKDGWGPGKDFGIKISMEGVDVTTAEDDELLFKMDMETWRWYDPEESRNFFMVGERSDGTKGAELAKPGESLE